MYNSGRKTSFSFETNVISVGNLSVGGTGKTPMIEYLIKLLDKKQMVTLSRGYGRKTKGFHIANDTDSPATVGDEPFQIFSKFNDIHVAVGEERAIAIPFILAEFPDTKVILLDDAFQHRPVKPSLSIMLTEYHKPFFKDYVLPSGRLRENRHGASRADIIVVTKCPQEINIDVYEREIKKYNDQALIAFSRIGYGKPMKWNGDDDAFEKKDILLVTGIANKAPLKEFLQQNYNIQAELEYTDHHKYGPRSLNEIINKFDEMQSDNKGIITTEKDIVKLKPLMQEKGIDIPLFYLPIETTFAKGGKAFDETILNSIIPYSN